MELVLKRGVAPIGVAVLGIPAEHRALVVLSEADQVSQDARPGHVTQELMAEACPFATL